MSLLIPANSVSMPTAEVSSVGNQPLSTKTSSPAYSLGAKPPPEYNDSLFVPGSTLDPPASVGEQPLSSKRSSPRVKFGREVRKSPEVRAGTDGEVGPGSYNNTSAIGTQNLSQNTSGPAYSMGAPLPLPHQPSSVDALYALPSAFGAQQHSHKQNAAAFTMGGRDHIIPDHYGVPGPGEYGGAAASGRGAGSGSPAYSFGGPAKPTRSRLHSRRSKKMGPGQCWYDSAFGSQSVSWQQSNPAFSFGSRSGRRRGGHTPGPGARPQSMSGIGAQALSRHATAPSFSLGSRLPESVDYARPGPGTYAASESMGAQAVAGHNSSPIHAFPKTKRMTKTASRSPGPGVTASPSSMGVQPLSRSQSSPAYSLQSRPQTSAATCSPGPGTYGRAPKSMPSPPGVHFGSSSRPLPRSRTPGPGTYGAASSMGRQLSSKAPSAPSFSMGGQIARPHTTHGRSRRKKKKKGGGGGGSAGGGARARGRDIAAEMRAEAVSSRRRTPGPGQYASPGSMGRQSLSQSKSTHGFSFGTPSVMDVKMRGPMVRLRRSPVRAATSGGRRRGRRGRSRKVRPKQQQQQRRPVTAEGYT